MLEKIIEKIIAEDFTKLFVETTFSTTVSHGVKKIIKFVAGNNKNKKEVNLNFKLKSDQDVIFRQLNYNLKKSINWSKDIVFKDLSRPKSISQIFIELDFFLVPSSIHFNEFQNERKSLIEAISNIDNHLIIAGGPGAGKTTLSKYLCLLLFDENSVMGGRFSSPFVLRLREVSSIFHVTNTIEDSLYYILAEEMGLEFESIFDDKKNIDENRKQIVFNEYYTTLKVIISELIDDLNLLIILDGFDEIKNDNMKRSFSREIEELTLSLNKSKIVLTTRIGEIKQTFSNSTFYEICPLTRYQIEKFIRKWITNSNDASLLLKQIENSPFQDTTIRPLNIAHLCALFERYHQIPDKPKSVYKKIIHLLIEDWDNQREIIRESKYSKLFTPDRKQEFLSHIAFILSSTQRLIFNKTELEKIYVEICTNYDLPKNQVIEVVNEIETHNGLFLQSGYDRFEFSHKSLQEFLTAEYIIKLGNLPKNYSLLLKMPNELAVATAISSNPNHFMAILFINCLKRDSLKENFLRNYLIRLTLEKPDFSDDVTGALVLSYLFTLIHYRKSSKYVPNNISELHDQINVDDKLLDLYGQEVNLLNGLLNENKNLQSSFLRLSHYYDSYLTVEFISKNYYRLTKQGSVTEIFNKIRIDEFEHSEIEKLKLPGEFYKYFIQPITVRFFM